MGVRRQVLRDEIQERILERLLESHWPPGSRLSIDGLARKLDVSPTPVREALVSLERSGLVEYTALRGYLVAPMLTIEQIAELVEARRTVETAVLSRAFDDWRAFLEGLESAHAAHTAVVARIDAAPDPEYALVREHFQCDWEFHQTWFNHAHNRYLRQMVETLRPHTHRMRQAWEGGPSGLDVHEALAEHERVLEKVREHNHDGAMHALTDHLENVLARSVALTRARQSG